MMATGAVYNADNLGVFTPANEPRDRLEAGQVGFIIAGIKELQAAKVGDTITLERSCRTTRALPPRHCPVSRKSSPRCLPGFTPPKRANTTSCAMRWKN